MFTSPKNLIVLTDHLTPEILTCMADMCGKTPETYSGHCCFRHIRDTKELRQKLFSFAQEHVLDMAILSPNTKLTNFRAVFFDMDSTLVNSETLDEIASIHGVGKECAAITAGAMSGRIKDYADSLRKRVALLSGQSAQSIDMVWNRMRPNAGAEQFIQTSHRLGLNTYIVSSGFTVLTEKMRQKLGMTATCANRIEIVNGRYTGRVFGPTDETILDASGKLMFVSRTMTELGLDPSMAICCGDGSNDIRMIDAAGIGVGFRPKAILPPHCDVVLNNRGFEGLLMLIDAQI